MAKSGKKNYIIGGSAVAVVALVLFTGMSGVDFSKLGEGLFKFKTYQAPTPDPTKDCTDYDISQEFEDEFGSNVLFGGRTICRNAGGYWTERSNELSCYFPPQPNVCGSDETRVAGEFCAYELGANFLCDENIGYVGCFCNIPSPDSCEIICSGYSFWDFHENDAQCSGVIKNTYCCCWNEDQAPPPDDEEQDDEEQDDEPEDDVGFYCEDNSPPNCGGDCPYDEICIEVNYWWGDVCECTAYYTESDCNNYCAGWGWDYGYMASNSEDCLYGEIYDDGCCCGNEPEPPPEEPRECTGDEDCPTIMYHGYSINQKCYGWGENRECRRVCYDSDWGADDKENYDICIDSHMGGTYPGWFPDRCNTEDVVIEYSCEDSEDYDWLDGSNVYYCTPHSKDCLGEGCSAGKCNEPVNYYDVSGAKYWVHHDMLCCGSPMRQRGRFVGWSYGGGYGTTGDDTYVTLTVIVGGTSIDIPFNGNYDINLDSFMQQFDGQTVTIVMQDKFASGYIRGESQWSGTVDMS